MCGGECESGVNIKTDDREQIDWKYKTLVSKEIKMKLTGSALVGQCHRYGCPGGIPFLSATLTEAFYTTNPLYELEMLFRRYYTDG